MKKIFISSDIEGTAGICAWDETELTKQDSVYFRAQMTREVSAACEGALAAGADEILVKDAHDSARNIDPSGLPRKVNILRNWTGGPMSMMAGIDESFAGTIYTGYHSGAGSDGNPLAHTMNTQNNYVLINGVKASELYINMLIASTLGVPSLMVTGDRALCEWAQSVNPAMETVAVSYGIGGASASIHPAEAVERIKTAAEKAAAGDLSKRLLPLPEKYNIEINYKDARKAYSASFYPGAGRIGVKTVTFECTNFMDARTFMYFVL